MSAVVLSNGENIGSSYEVVGGFAWNVVIRDPNGVKVRQGRQKDKMTVRYAMVAGARELGVVDPVLMEID